LTGRLEGKAAVVVGAGQMAGETTGNGRAVALRFAREGARVLVVDRDSGAAEETAALIKGEGGEALVQRCDVADEADCAALAETAVRLFGRVDVLHNNVGVLDVADGGSVELSPEVWQRTLDVNLRGMWLMSRAFLPTLRTQGAASIINTSSIGSVMLAGTPLAYALSKVGINGLTQSLAIENAPYGVRVNALLLGLIHTPMAVADMTKRRGIPAEEFEARRSAAVPLGRSGTAWDVANAALFLASDEASFITGALLPVDGGTLLRIG
jgi:NAD(P)-dependent dehydrogenase (short-subunit alcohol dehydrogenase family)